MAGEMSGPWKIEEIPDDHTLYMRVHRNDVKDGRPIPGVFKNRPNPGDSDAPRAMSTDWCSYSTAQQTQARGRRSLPSDNGVIALGVAGVRRLYQQQVQHTPWFQDPEDEEVPNNQAHTDVIGPKSPREVNDSDGRIQVLTVRVGLVELAQWAINPPHTGAA